APATEQEGRLGELGAPGRDPGDELLHVARRADELRRDLLALAARAQERRGEALGDRRAAPYAAHGRGALLDDGLGGASAFDGLEQLGGLALLDRTVHAAHAHQVLLRRGFAARHL